MFYSRVRTFYHVLVCQHSYCTIVIVPSVTKCDQGNLVIWESVRPLLRAPSVRPSS